MKRSVVCILVALVVGSCTLTGCSDMNPFEMTHEAYEYPDQVPFKGPHNIYLFVFDSEGLREETDTLTITNEAGEVIETLDLGPGRAAYCIPYDDLGYKEHLSLTSEKYGETLELMSMYEYDEEVYCSECDAEGVPQYGNWNDIRLDYCGTIGTWEDPDQWCEEYGDHCEEEYADWQNGFVLLDISVINYDEIPKSEWDEISLYFYATYSEDKENVVVPFRIMDLDEYQKPFISELLKKYEDMYVVIDFADGQSVDVDMPSDWTEIKDCSIIVDMGNKTVTFEEK